MDNIVEVIMPRDASLEPLDEADAASPTFASARRWRNCAAARPDHADGPPTFVWSLPQDIHVAVLNREGTDGLDTTGYDGFHAPYAARVRRFDGCFGGFIDDLKARGLYDQSIIVLTSDHGDSLGEEGRFGHAYTIYPEVLQVPLVVHVPPALRQRFDSAPDALAFTTDITPTLHALLGHEVRPPSPIFGRPLVWPRGTRPPAAAPFGLVASSYGTVYGWIDGGGRSLYIADGVGMRDYAYQLDGSAAGIGGNVTAQVRAEGQRAIRAGITAIAEAYRFFPPE